MSVVDQDRVKTPPKPDLAAVEAELQRQPHLLLKLADIVKRADVRMIERRDDAGFAVEPLYGERLPATRTSLPCSGPKQVRRAPMSLCAGSSSRYLSVMPICI